MGHTKLNDDELTVLQCKACRRFLGYGTRRTTSFCGDDIFCLATKEWVSPVEREIGLVAHLREVEGLTIPEIATELGKQRYQVHDLYKLHRERKLHARM